MVNIAVNTIFIHMFKVLANKFLNSNNFVHYLTKMVINLDCYYSNILTEVNNIQVIIILKYSNLFKNILRKLVFLIYR